jgi:prepilin-type N-terminal cleavage/methylation domain-containing protein
MLNNTDKNRAFTLIELLIVVAIIAILASIAVPNFLAAQTRSKVSRVKSDFRTITIGLESYAVERNYYPWFSEEDPDPAYTKEYGQINYRLFGLTTPVAYLDTLDYPDPFSKQGTVDGYEDGFKRYQYSYRNHYFFWEDEPDHPLNGKAIWVLNSIGPDSKRSYGLQIEEHLLGLPTSGTAIYDATNGTSSYGDIPWAGGSTHYGNR